MPAPAILDHRGSPMRMTDGLANALTGAGTSIDRSRFSFYAQTYINEQQILASYRTSWLMRNVVDMPAGDAVSKGRDWHVEKDRIAEIEKAEKSFGLWPKLRHGLELGRLGGGALIIGADQGEVSQPLDAERIGKGQLNYLHAVSRFELNLGPEIRDLVSPWFGKPEYFELRGRNGEPARIHPSRVITFHGLPVPRSSIIPFEHSFWGDPIYQSMVDAIQNADKGQSGFAALIDLARTVDWCIPDMNQNLLTTPGYDERLSRQIGIVEQSVSLHRARIHDAAETVTVNEMQWGGIPAFIWTLLAIVAAGARMPATRLLGKSPDGMNATGEGDERNYIGTLEDVQDYTVRPALEVLDPLILRSASISTDDLDWRFAPIAPLSEIQQTEIAAKKATTIKTYLDAGMNADALIRGAENMIIEDGWLPGFDEALDEFATELPSGDPVDETDPSAITDPEAEGGGQPSAGGGNVRPPRRTAPA